MATERIRLVQGDTRPQVRVTITDENTGDPVNITGAAVVMKFRAQGATALTATLSGAVVDGPNGVAVFDWNATPTALDGEPGNYEGEVEITFSDGSVQTLWEPLQFRLREDF